MKRRETPMELYKKYGAIKKDNGYEFSVYAPDVDDVKLKIQNKYFKMNNENGVWTRSLENIKEGLNYSYIITKGSEFHEKADPFAKVIKYKNNKMESYIYESKYIWRAKNKYNIKTKKMKILEVLLKEVSGKDYIEKTKAILELLKDSNYTHIELMPIFSFYDRKTMGYKPDSFFAIDSYFGTPDDFKFLIDELHINGYGVIVDFPMMEFDCLKITGTLHNFNFNYLYNKNKGLKHPVFTGYYMDFNKKYIRDFLLSSINNLINEFNIDGFRFDGVNEIIFEHGNNNKIKEEELINMRDFLRQVKDVIIILENITSIHNDILQLPNISITEGSLWMYDIYNVMKLDPYKTREDTPLQLVYEYKNHLYNQSFISASLNHDMFIDGINYKIQYGRLSTKEDFLLILKILYAINRFPKMLYFDMFYKSEEYVKEDFKEFVKLYDTLDLIDSEFQFKYENGIIKYTFLKDNKKYMFNFNVTSQEKNLEEQNNIIYPKNYSYNFIKPFTTIIQEIIYESK
jgi:1,4-alpha-glucan branching enzyme